MHLHTHIHTHAYVHAYWLVYIHTYIHTGVLSCVCEADNGRPIAERVHLKYFYALKIKDKGKLTPTVDNEERDLCATISLEDIFSKQHREDKDLHVSALLEFMMKLFLETPSEKGMQERFGNCMGVFSQNAVPEPSNTDVVSPRLGVLKIEDYYVQDLHSAGDLMKSRIACKFHLLHGKQAGALIKEQMKGRGGAKRATDHFVPRHMPLHSVHAAPGWPFSDSSPQRISESPKHSRKASEQQAPAFLQGAAHSTPQYTSFNDMGIGLSETIKTRARRPPSTRSSRALNITCLLSPSKWGASYLQHKRIYIHTCIHTYITCKPLIW